MKKLVVWLVWLLASFSSFAVVPTVSGYRSTLPSGQFSDARDWADSQGAVTALFNSNHSPANYVIQSADPTSFYIYSSTAWQGYTGGTSPIQVCPANSTLQGGSCVCTPPAVEDPTHTSCIVPAPDVCAAGAGVVATYNVTSGYSRSVAGAGLYPPLLPDGSPSPAGYIGLPPESMCIAGCKHSRGAVVDSWTSLEPTATGLYRQSDDWSFTSTPTSCVPTASETAALKPDAAVPGCVGFLGQINGKISCVASVGSQNTVTSTKPNLAIVGNPTAGSSGGVGGIPSTGGNGANAGGPKGSADGSAVVGGQVIAGAGTAAPTGTASAPAAGEEQVACGAPGQPRCAIDETGTPNGKDAITSDGIAAQFDKLGTGLDGVLSADGKDTSWGLVPHWLASSGGCAPSEIMSFPAKLNIPPLTLDICPMLPLIYTLMNLLWVTATFGVIISMVLRVTT